MKVDAKGFGILLPESVSSKRIASNETRQPPLQGKAKIVAYERFPFLGVIRVVPRY